MFMQRKQLKGPVVDVIYSSDYDLDNWGELVPATDGSAGYDLRACIKTPITIKPGETVLVPTGFKLHIKSRDIAAYLYPRSGKGSSKGLVLGNLTGIIDSDYQGEVRMALWNRVDVDVDRMLGLAENLDPKPAQSDWCKPDVIAKSITIQPGEAVAQMIFGPVIHPVLTKVDSFEFDTERGQGGFGSTDSKAK